MKDYINRIKVHQKIMILYVFIVLSTVSSLGYINMTATNRITQEYLESIEATLDIVSQDFENELFQVMKFQGLMLEDDDVLDLSNKVPILTEYEITERLSDLNMTLYKFISVSKWIDDFGIYIPSVDKMVSYLAGIDRGSDKGVPEFLTTLKQNDGYVYFNGDYYISRNWGTVRYEGVTSYARLSRNEVESELHGLQTIINDSKVTLFIDDEPLMSVASDGYNDTSDTVEIRTEPNILGFSFGVTFDEGNISSDLYDIRLRYIVIVVGHILIALLFTISISRLIRTPLNRLSAYMRHVQNGDLNMRIEVFDSGEFRCLEEGFNDMLNSLNDYIEENYEQNILLKQSELKQLQTQINPHFLYNCFYNISQMCNLEDLEGAKGIAVRLATYYQYITRTNESKVELKKEYKHMMDYIHIQEYRYENRVEIICSELCCCHNIKVPKMILQPIVENCYKYVFEKKNSHCILRIRVAEDDRRCIIQIEDNGVWSEDLESVLGKKISALSSEERTGLANVSRRLELCYGNNNPDEDEPLIFASKSDIGGTCITLNLPKT